MSQNEKFIIRWNLSKTDMLLSGQILRRIAMSLKIDVIEKPIKKKKGLYKSDIFIRRTEILEIPLYLSRQDQIRL